MLINCSHCLQLSLEASSVRCTICKSISYVSDSWGVPMPPGASHPLPPLGSLPHPSPLSGLASSLKPSGGGRRKAVICGVTDRNTRNELMGCINDDKCMKYLLINRYSFPESKVSSVQTNVQAAGLKNTAALLDEMKLLGEVPCKPTAKKVLNSELWHACAGPLVSLPQPGSLVFYFPQGHIEQADRETDEIYAQMTLQPVTCVSIGMRFGMMFETEESSKGRYMGTIVGISDYDPVRWPNSRWRNLQVEWYEHGYGERPDRVSLWEIETQESLFAFPNVTSSLKRQCLPGYVGPAINNHFLNLKPFPKPTEDENVNTHPFFAGLGSENLSWLLNNPCNPNRDSLLGHHQSIYASLLQNVRSSELSGSLSVTIPALHTMGSSTQQEIVTTAAMQQKQHFSPQWEMVPFQNVVSQEHRLNLVHQGIKLDFVSGTHVKSQVSDSEEACPAEHEQNFQDHNARGENGIRQPGSEDISLHESIPQQSEVASVVFPGDLDSQSDGMIKPISHDMLAEHMDQLSKHQNGESSTSTGPFDHVNLAAQISAKQALQVKEQSDPKLVQLQNDPTRTQTPGLDAAQSSDMCNLNYLLPHQDCLHHILDNDDWMTQHSCLQSFMGSSKTPEFPYINSKLDSFYLSAAENATTSSADLSSLANPNNFEPAETFQLSCISDSGTPQCITTDIQEYLGTQLNSLADELLVQGILSSEVHDLDVQGDYRVLQGVSNSYGIMDLFEESNNQGETIGNLHLDPSNESLDMVHVPGVAMGGLSPVGSSRFQIPSVMPVCNFTSNQESMSHITSTRMTDSVFSLQDIANSSAGTSSANMATYDYSLYRGSRKQACQQPLRTYTKVKKAGSVGRSIDVTRFSNYYELRSAVACMFGLEGHLDDPRGSEWKLVYVDFENDVLQVGDDPWEEFINCVKCIRILSPSEVQQMSQEAMQLMDGFA